MKCTLLFILSIMQNDSPEHLPSVDHIVLLLQWTLFMKDSLYCVICSIDRNIKTCETAFAYMPFLLLLLFKNLYPHVSPPPPLSPKLHPCGLCLWILQYTVLLFVRVKFEDLRTEMLLMKQKQLPVSVWRCSRCLRGHREINSPLTSLYFFKQSKYLSKLILFQ